MRKVHDDNWSDSDCKHLSEEFSGEQLNLVKQNWVYSNEYMDSFEKLSEDKLPDRSKFYSSLKNECIKKRSLTC